MNAKILLAVTGALATGFLSATAKDIFVSTDSAWKMPGLEGETYTDLQTAVSKAAAGDTVWIQDGFRCTEGKTSEGDMGNVRVELPNVAFTLRSESGFVDLEQGKGATITGAFDPETTSPADGRGPNATRPLRVCNSNTILMGLILEGGSTPDHFLHGYGGAVLGGGVFTNCLFRNNYATHGGAIYDANARVYHCVFTNNTAYQTYYGGGAIGYVKECRDSLFVGNHGNVRGGAAYSQWGESIRYVFSNCTFRANDARNGGAICMDKGACICTDCRFEDNRAMSGHGGACCGSNEFFRCSFVANCATDSGGAIDGYAADRFARLWECVVSNNTSGIGGGGMRYAIAEDTTVVSNLTARRGGGAYACRLKNCRVLGNTVRCSATSGESRGGGGAYLGSATGTVFAGNRVEVTNDPSAPVGGGVLECTLYNCVVSNNFCTGRGSGVFGPISIYNCLVVDNFSTLDNGYHWIGAVAGNYQNEADSIKCYNCTIVGNRLKTPSRHPGACRASLFNCVLDDNGDDPLCELYIASNCCCLVTDKDALKYRTLDNATYHYGNVNADPRLTVGCRLSSLKPCMNVAEPYGWMTAADDVRSKDLDGNPRILGAGPDMGCYERKPVGLSLLVR